MSRLFKLREWLTPDETARHLTILFGEEVRTSDVLRLGLDGHLTLSVDFVNHAEAMTGRVIPFKDVPMMRMPPMSKDGMPAKEEVYFPDGLRLEDDQELNENTPFVHFARKVVTIRGLWDLVMDGGERIDIENRFQAMTGGPPVELVNMDGTFVKRDDGVWASLQEELPNRPARDEDGKRAPATYMPANGLPPDSVLVVRTAALREFERLVNDPESIEQPPFFDADAPDYPSLLHIAVRAWEHVREGGEGTPKQRVQNYLMAHYPSMPMGSKAAIAQVVNWRQSGGRPPKKTRTGG